MNSHVRQFYQKNEKTSSDGPFVGVISLEEDQKMSYKEARQQAPDFPKGWYELSRLKVEDRVEFTRDYWLNTLPFVPNFHKFINEFFQNLEDVSVFLTKMKPEDPYHCEMVYSLKDDGGFFRGGVFCTKEQIDVVNDQFKKQLPEDYLHFLKIHNGFTKANDLGVIRAENLKLASEKFYEMLEQEDRLITCSKKPVNPRHLMPFYHSLGLQSFQCFFTDWYPSGNMGNVYFSGVDHSISSYQNKETWTDQMAFPTFLDWLKFYMEEINLD